MGLKEGIKGLFGLKEAGQIATLSAASVKAAREAERSRKVVIRIYDKKMNRNEVVEGQLSDSHNFLYDINHNRMWMEAAPFMENGLLICQVSANYHRCLDMGKLNDIAGKMKMTVTAAFERGQIFENFHIDDIYPHFDLSLWDNRFSASFISDSFMVLKAKTLELLLEPPKRVWLLSVVISGLLGLIFGMTGMGILMFLIRK